MTSRDKEDEHALKISAILEAHDIECDYKSISIASEYFDEEEGLPIAEDTSLVEELSVVEEKSNVQIEIIEEEEKIFPTPSLRKILPQQIRDAESINRIHVLPERFNNKIDPTLIPKISVTPPREYIDQLASLVFCENYRASMPEYWFLDTLANLLRRAQKDNFDRVSQASLIVWFCELMKEIQFFDAADRQRFLRRIRDNMVDAAGYVADQESLPRPADVGVDYRPPADRSSVFEALLYPDVRAPAESDRYSCGLTYLARMMHYFYDLFSTDYQYELIRSVFTHTPEYNVVHSSLVLNQPKGAYTLAKAKKKEKDKREKDKGKSKVVENAEYMRLMEIKEKEEKEIEEREALEAAEWEKKSHILPLAMSENVDDNFFEQYFPNSMNDSKK